MKQKMNDSEFGLQRQEMVTGQIYSRGIKDQSVINAMLKIPRDIFVPEKEKNHSYYDGPLPIGYGQTISQPYIVAYMTELLELSGKEKVLEIGTGSGYQTAILAEIVDEVYSMEVIEELLEMAREKLNDKLSYTNIHYKLGNGRRGWSEKAPFDRILAAAAAEKFPQELFAQLNEGGIAVAPIGNYYQKMVRFRKLKGRISEESLIGVSFVPFV